MNQQMITVNGDYEALTNWFELHHVRRLLVVCDKVIPLLKINKFLNKLQSPVVIPFNCFQPNPLYESVVEGVDLLNREQCDAIMAVGGGSAIDVAKCIKLFSNMDSKQNYLHQSILPNDLPLVAMPTTAGTGSEATRFAVIYDHGEKQSISDYSCIPSAVIFDASVLKTLPIYQKKSTMMDAFCHAVESFWSINSTVESKEYAANAIQILLDNMDGYLTNDDEANNAMMRAANFAGKAINITQTTAGHAMCYKLTSLYGVAHGHAAALCVRKLWPWMLNHTERCIDPRGEEYLQKTLLEIATAMDARSAEEAAVVFENIFDKLQLPIPELDEEVLPTLVTSINPVRLKNHPISLAGQIENLYRQILR